MRRLALALFIVAPLAGSDPGRDAHILNWSHLPALPQAISRHAAGRSHGAILVAGGAQPPAPSAGGGPKAWLDTVYVLEAGGDHWLSLKLDRPLAGAASVTTDDAMVVMGGGNAQGYSSDVFSLQWRDGRLHLSRLPSLPRSVAHASAAILDDTIYLAGGQDAPSASSALHKFWALDLSRAGQGWRELEPWPGPGRISPVLVAQAGAVYLFSGAELVAGAGGTVTRRYLRDAHRFRPGKGWIALRDCPRPLVAAPAVAYGQSHILVFGGDDGASASRIRDPNERNPEASREVLAFHTITRTWVRRGMLPGSLVAAPAVMWRGSVVIPGGEDAHGRPSATVFRGEPPQSRTGLGVIDFAVLGLYLVAIVLMGVYLTRRNRSAGEFFLGGRNIPWWAAGLSIYGTQLSSITFMAIPAKAYAANWTYALVNLCILLVAPVVVLYYMPFFHRLNVTTAYEYLEKRFNRTVRIFCSALFIVFQIGRLAVVMFLPAIALATVSDVNVYWCIFLMGSLAIAYTIMGGIQAVIWTDVVQCVVLVSGALLCLVLAVSGVDGGLTGLVAVAQRDAKLRIIDWTWDMTTATVWVLMVGNLASVLSSYTSDQTVIQKYLTTRDVKQSGRSIWANALLAIPSTIIFFGIGTALYAYYQSHPDQLNPQLPTDAIFPWFMVQALPVGVAGLLVAALFAAAQSTLSSSMHSVATALIVDFYQPLRRNSSDKMRLRLARILICATGVAGTSAALLMATYDIRSLFDVFLTLLSLLGGSLAGIFALAVFTMRTTGRGVLLGGVASAAVVMLVRATTPIHFFLYAPIGLAVCVAVGYLASGFMRDSNGDLAGLTVYTANH